jgi:hypothetical protein
MVISTLSFFFLNRGALLLVPMHRVRKYDGPRDRTRMPSARLVLLAKRATRSFPKFEASASLLNLVKKKKSASLYKVLVAKTFCLVIIEQKTIPAKLKYPENCCNSCQ